MKDDAVNRRINILIAEDDADDRMMTQEAFEECCKDYKIHFVNDGEELMDYLLRKNNFSDNEKFPMPDIILLDLNMPRKDGREALREIKTHPLLKRIPVIVLTTSKAEDDIYKTYDLGVNCFITKPVTYAELVDLTKTLSKYWFEIAMLPGIIEHS